MLTCKFKMFSEDDQGRGLVNKPTGFLTLSDHIRNQLDKKCLGRHKHVQLVGGRAKACQVYPDNLVRAILRGIGQELTHNGIVSLVYHDLLHVEGEDADVNEYEGHFIDDMSGQQLRTDLVIKAR